jgi:hypothetical protein
MSLITNLKHLLSLRVTSFIIVILSLTGRVVQKLASFGIDDDKLFQVQATKNLLAGHGISIHEVVGNNLSVSQYTPLIKWPPGYSILLSPFHAVSGPHDLWGTLWLDLLTCIVFVILARKLIQSLDTPTWLVNVFTLLSGFYLYDFFATDSSDGITLVFFMGALLLTLKFLRSSTKTITASTLIVLLLFGCCLLRYMYFPVVLLIPAYVIWCGRDAKDKLLTRCGVYMIVLLATLIGSLMILQGVNTGAGVYVVPLERGFYPAHILKTTPFLISSAGNFGVSAILLDRATGIGMEKIQAVFISVHLALFVLLGLLSLKWAKQKKFRANSISDHYTYLLILTTLGIVAVLTYLSLTYATILLGSGTNWTYLMESRYFAAPVFLFQLWLVVTVEKNVRTGRLRKLFGVFLVLPLIISLLHAMYFTGKKIAGGNKNFLQREELVTLQLCEEFLHRFVIEKNGANIICASGDPMFNNYASIWENIPGLYDYRNLNNPERLIAEKPTIILVPVKSWHAKNLESFLNNPKRKYAGSVRDWQFHYIEVVP